MGECCESPCILGQKSIFLLVFFRSQGMFLRELFIATFGENLHHWLTSLVVQVG